LNVKCSVKETRETRAKSVLSWTKGDQLHVLEKGKIKKIRLQNMMGGILHDCRVDVTCLVGGTGTKSVQQKWGAAAERKTLNAWGD